MSSVKMIGIAEHCDLSCDWIIKAVYLRRRSLHCLWHSAAGVTQDKLLLWLGCTSHQWCNYEIDVVLIQISIWKPIIDRCGWCGGRSRSAYRKICSAAADGDFGLQRDTWSRYARRPTLMCTVAGQPFLFRPTWITVIYFPEFPHLVCQGCSRLIFATAKTSR